MRATYTPPTHLFSWLRILGKQKWVILAVWPLLFLLGAIVLWQIPPHYKAETSILVVSQNIPTEIVNATVRDDVNDRLATITKRIMSSTRLQKIMETYGLYTDERKELPPEEVVEIMRKDISVQLERGWTQDRAGAFRVGYRSDKPTLAADVANQLGSLFIEENYRARESNVEGTAEFVSSQLEESRKRLNDLEQQVTQYKVSHSGALPQQENALTGSLMRLNTQLQGIQEAMSRAQQNKMAAENALHMAESSSIALKRAIEVSGNQSQANDGGSRVEKLKATLAVAQTRYRDNHPDIQVLKQQIAEAEKQEAAENAKATDGKSVSANRVAAMTALNDAKENERLGALRMQIKFADNDYNQREKERVETMKQIAALEAKITTLPMREQEIAELTRDYENAKVNYRSLLDKKFQAEMAADMERRQKAERFTVLDPATPPAKPSSPDRPLILALMAPMGLCIAVVLAAVRELGRDVLLGSWELPESVPVLATVGYMQSSRRKMGFSRFGIGKKAAASISAVLVLMFSLAGYLFHRGAL